MKLYQVKNPQLCNIEGCGNTNAVLIVKTDEQINHAVCPDCVQKLCDMNSDNKEFFTQTPLPGIINNGRG